MKNTIITVLLTISLILGLVIFFQGRKIDHLQNNQVTDTITLTLTDTVEVVKPTLIKKDIVRYDTLTLPSDTLFVYDTLTDTVRIPVPISNYVLDTIITTDSSKTHLRGVLEGFSVSVDSLSITYEKVHQEVLKTPKKWHWGFGFALGFGYVR